jgi:hypothetical protein
MRKLILALAFPLALLIYPSVLAAQGMFFVQPSDMWTVEGHNQNGKYAPVCKAVTRWQDGSSFHLIADLYDGEIYILFTNKNWNVLNFTNEAYELKILIRKDGEVADLRGFFEFIGPDTIRIRNIKEKFVDVFAEADELRLLMPGNMPSADVRLVGSKNAVHYMATCIKYYNITR